MDITTNIIDIIGQGIITAGLLFPVIRKYASKVGPVLVKEAEPIAKAANTVVHSLEEVLKLPEFAAVRLKLLEGDRKLKDSELLKVAGIALHGYEKNLDALTANEKGTLVAFVRSSLAKVNVEVSDQAIVRALNDAQNLADAFKATDAFKHTAELEQSLKALAAEPAPAVNAPDETAQTTV